MESALGWLGKIFDFAISLLPHLFIVNADSRAVKFSRGRLAVEKSPGVYFYWPLVTETPTIVCVARRTNCLQSQRLTSRDNHTIILSLGVIGRVVDPIKAIKDTENFDDDINQACLKAATTIVLSSTFEDLTQSIIDGSFVKDVKKQTAQACRPYGYKVEDIFVSDWCRARVFAIVGDGLADPE